MCKCTTINRDTTGEDLLRNDDFICKSLICSLAIILVATITFTILSIFLFMSGCNPEFPGGCLLTPISYAIVTNFTTSICDLNNPNKCAIFSVNFDCENYESCVFRYNNTCTPTENIHCGDLESQYVNIKQYRKSYAIGNRVKVAYVKNDDCDTYSTCIIGVEYNYDYWLAGVICLLVGPILLILLLIIWIIYKCAKLIKKKYTFTLYAI